MGSSTFSFILSLVLLTFSSMISDSRVAEARTLLQSELPLPKVELPLLPSLPVPPVSSLPVPPVSSLPLPPLPELPPLPGVPVSIPVPLPNVPIPNVPIPQPKVNNVCCRIHSSSTDHAGII
ncbi:hypothetical protein CR513_31066, partial [Mucuna pruriens]